MAGVKYLGKPEPVPYVEEADLLLLAADLGAGWHSAGYLFDWYVASIRAVGRKPVTTKWFGMALREAGWTSSTRRVGGVPTRCWLITRPWHQRGQEAQAA